jgi:hypothetical protein
MRVVRVPPNLILNSRSDGAQMVFRDVLGLIEAAGDVDAVPGWFAGLGVNRLALLGAGRVPITGDGVTGPGETNEAFRFDVQQVARAGPLVAARRFARLARRP